MAEERAEGDEGKHQKGTVQAQPFAENACCSGDHSGANVAEDGQDSEDPGSRMGESFAC